jgi:hypothetical protein
MIGRPTMVGEQQEAKRDLPDDQGLRQGEQLGDRCAGASAPSHERRD